MQIVEIVRRIDVSPTEEESVLPATAWPPFFDFKDYTAITFRTTDFTQFRRTV